MTANATSATPPMIATRSASCGVSDRAPVVVEVHQISRPREAERARLARCAWRRRPARAGRTISDGAQQRADDREHGSASSALGARSRACRGSRAGSRAAPTSSMNDTAAKVGTQPAVAAAPTGDRHQPVARVAHLAEAPDAVADRREHQRGGAHRGARARRSSRKPAAKPTAQPGDAARRSTPIAATVSTTRSRGRRSTLVWLTAETWRITASSSSTPTRTNVSGDEDHGAAVSGSEAACWVARPPREHLRRCRSGAGWRRARCARAGTARARRGRPS